MTKLKLDISMSLDGYIAGPMRASTTRSARAASGCTNGSSDSRQESA